MTPREKERREYGIELFRQKPTPSYKQVKEAITKRFGGGVANQTICNYRKAALARDKPLSVMNIEGGNGLLHEIANKMRLMGVAVVRITNTDNKIEIELL
jgi:hypothetical protein